MEKKYFPLYMDISKKNIVVIGGGTIATRRVHTLVEFAEQIIVVAPEVSKELEALIESGKVSWILAGYQKEHIQNADIVVAATNEIQVNHQIKKDCQLLEKESNRQILVSVADDKTLCDFYFPSIIKTQDTVIGINSGGKSPGLTKRIRQKIEELLNCESMYN